MNLVSVVSNEDGSLSVGYFARENVYCIGLIDTAPPEIQEAARAAIKRGDDPGGVRVMITKPLG